MNFDCYFWLILSELICLFYMLCIYLSVCAFVFFSLVFVHVFNVHWFFGRNPLWCGIEWMQRQLCTVAKRVIAKIPTKSIKPDETNDPDNDCCAICIEPYKTTDVIRVLPCKWVNNNNSNNWIYILYWIWPKFFWMKNKNKRSHYNLIDDRAHKKKHQSNNKQVHA